LNELYNQGLCEKIIHSDTHPFSKSVSQLTLPSLIQKINPVSQPLSPSGLISTPTPRDMLFSFVAFVHMSFPVCLDPLLRNIATAGLLMCYVFKRPFNFYGLACRYCGWLY